MKKILSIALPLLIITNFFAQKKSLKKTNTKTKYEIKIPNISKDNLEIPDLSNLVKLENKKIFDKTKDSSRMININNIQDYDFSIQKDKNNFNYYKYKNGQLQHIQKNTKQTISSQVEKGEDPASFSQTIHTYIDFYSNGNIFTIKQYNDTDKGAYSVGNWYVYDEKGNLLQHIDHKKYFKMTYNDIAKIANSYNDYPSKRISRYFDKTGSYWYIRLGGYQDQPIEPKIIILEDKTGKILSEFKKEEFYNFQELEKYQEKLYKLFKNK
ncbi:hypothetical protein [Chryseobacterium turcicum]|uniref:Uncharacterized protein n=1 Tax=Chryseobacterium turcicum TaxID=2898076 RepID=A0A9Q3UZX5_9FLAO|nr:hypothetical protein [Chryseobacterium turcicum]MCD1115276.1 hypothetical protein [Chryseobacterium turcicum]